MGDLFQPTQLSAHAPDALVEGATDGATTAQESSATLSQMEMNRPDLLESGGETATGGSLGKGVSGPQSVLSFPQREQLTNPEAATGATTLCNDHAQPSAGKVPGSSHDIEHTSATAENSDFEEF